MRINSSKLQAPNPNSSRRSRAKAEEAPSSKSQMDQVGQERSVSQGNGASPRAEQDLSRFPKSVLKNARAHGMTPVLRSAPLGAWDLGFLWDLELGAWSFRSFTRRPCRQSRPNAFRRDSAFTLLELIVAAAMFSIIMAALGGVFFGTMKLRKRTDESLVGVHQLQQALMIIKSDLRSATIPGGLLSTNMTTSLELAASGGTQFEFHTASGQSSGYEPWPDIQRVTYYLRQPQITTATNGMDLIRGTTRNLLATVQEDINEQILLHDVAQIWFEFWDGEAWLPDWDSDTQIASQAASAPEAIRFSIEFKQQPNEPQPRILQVAAPVFTGGITNVVETAEAEQ